LFDPRMLIEEPVRVLVVIAIIVLGKSLAAFALVLAFRYPLNTALTVSASLAQIGEFSFILAALGVSLKLLPPEGQSLILAGALVSIALNPLIFSAIEPLQAWIRRRSTLARSLERPDDPLAELPASVPQRQLEGHVLLVGHGRTGRRIADALLARGMAIVVAEQNRELVEALRARGVPAVAGDAADPVVLVQAHVARARVLVITVPDAFLARKMIEIARALNPGIVLMVRVQGDDEAKLLQAAHQEAFVSTAEEALADTMVARILEEKVKHEAASATR